MLNQLLPKKVEAFAGRRVAAVSAGLAHSLAIAADGTLSAIGHYPTEATPRFFELDPSGRFVYAVGQGSGGLTAYRIDATTGALDPFEQHKVGESPLWITFIKQA